MAVAVAVPAADVVRVEDSRREGGEREQSLHQGREQRKEEGGAAGKWFYNYEGRVQVEWKLLVVCDVSSLKERRADPK